MGNCQHGRPATWADDDYDYEEEEEMIREISLSEKKMKMEPVTKEVKIKITKKQLEELLHKAEMQGLPLQQALMVLMSVGNVVGEPENGKHWRPALQSIPEVAE